MLAQNSSQDEKNEKNAFSTAVIVKMFIFAA
jgi:hypothetical protein